MGYDLDGSSEWFELSSAIVTAKPVTMAAWVYRNASGIAHMVMCVGDGAAASTLNQLYIGIGGGNDARVYQFIAGSYSNVSGGTIGASAWHHICGVFPTSGNSLIYVDGSSTGGAISNSDPSGMDTTLIGCITNTSSGRTNHLNGKVAEAGIWNVALSADEVASLAKGMRPFMVRPDSLLWYPSLLRTPKELMGAQEATANGTPAPDIHPPVFY